MLAAIGAEGGPGEAELLRLAAGQRMSTDTRRAVFCVVMGSDDYVDASERLLRLPLKVGHGWPAAEHAAHDRRCLPACGLLTHVAVLTCERDASSSCCTTRSAL